MDFYDIIVIGGGITGGLILRELSKYRLKLLLLEKQNDFGWGATRANSAIVHAGYDPAPGTLKAKLNLPGSLAYPALCRELDALYEPMPSLVVAYSGAETAVVERLYRQGRDYGVPGLKIINRQELKTLEPNISDSALCALYAPSAGITEPWGIASNAVENAAENGAAYRRNSEVCGIEKTGAGFVVETKNGETFRAAVVIACAGISADSVHALVASPDFTITGRKGHYFVLDRTARGLVGHILFSCPSENGKGVLITPALHDKLLLGPDSKTCADRDTPSTEADRLTYVREAVGRYLCVPVPFNLVIRSFAGIRPTPNTRDFIIREAPDVPGFIDVAGIESPGIASAPAIADYVVGIVKGILGNLQKRADFHSYRRPQVRFSALSAEKQAALMEQDPMFACMVCKCEQVTEAEITDCIRRKAGARSVKGVKMRTGAGFGRCQAGFCQPEVVDILARELKIDKTDVLYANSGSNLLTGRTKE